MSDTNELWRDEERMAVWRAMGEPKRPDGGGVDLAVAATDLRRERDEALATVRSYNDAFAQRDELREQLSLAMCWGRELADRAERFREIINGARYCLSVDAEAAARACLEGNGLEDGVADELRNDLDMYPRVIDELRRERDGWREEAERRGVERDQARIELDRGNAMASMHLNELREVAWDIASEHFDCSPGWASGEECIRWIREKWNGSRELARIAEALLEPVTPPDGMPPLIDRILGAIEELVAERARERSTSHHLATDLAAADSALRVIAALLPDVKNADDPNEIATHAAAAIREGERWARRNAVLEKRFARIRELVR
jgi:hypothetical protein